LPLLKSCHDRILEGIERRLEWGIGEPDTSIIEVWFPYVGEARPRSDPQCREWDRRRGRPRRQAAADLVEQGGVRVGSGGGSRHDVRVGGSGTVVCARGHADREFRAEVAGGGEGLDEARGRWRRRRCR
jgi:hypothetical protein